MYLTTKQKQGDTTEIVNLASESGVFFVADQPSKIP